MQLTRKKASCAALLWFTICVDLYELERFMKLRGWEGITNDLSRLFFGIQEAAYMAQNMLVAGESLGLSSCFLGNAPCKADKIARDFKLPSRVFPLVQLVMGYPAEEFPPRPRWPLSFTLFEDRYPDLTDEQVAEAMKVMDEGTLAQGYHAKQKAKIRLENERKVVSCRSQLVYRIHGLIFGRQAGSNSMVRAFVRGVIGPVPSDLMRYIS